MDLFKLDTYDFELPPDRIAQYPVHPRDHSRLLHVDRASGSFHHYQFHQITEILKAGDVLVLNETRVIPARLFGKKDKTGASVEVFLLRPGEVGWDCLVRPAKRLKIGDTVKFGAGRLQGEIIGELDIPGGRRVRFFGAEDFDQALAEVGEIPLPPYIRREAKPSDQEDYQTVYAREAGSVAAPTAGLHFTGELLEQLGKKKIQIARLVLHVGIGTFRPVEVEDIREHRMHSELYTLSESDAALLNRARSQGGRIVAVGTTVARTLETVYEPISGFQARTGETDIFIYPGYTFRAVDALITNFHLPKSSLLMLVSAFGGYELMAEAYQQALDFDYRFFSYGDAMIIT